MMYGLSGQEKYINAFGGFFAKSVENGIFPRAVRYYKGDELLLLVDVYPYNDSDRIQVYSLSKAFTSIACGIASDMGILDINKPVNEIFPDKMPKNITARLKKTRLCDILAMKSGHACCVLDKCIASGDSIKTFFETEQVYEPDTKFVYSTAGTMVCGAAVTRASGLPLDEFLNKYLFAPLSIPKPQWDKTADGLCYGGVGLRVNSDDIAKLGRMLASKGVFEGKRIVTEEYLKTAASPLSIDSLNGTPDWVAGYGYQFWLNSFGGYRGDGAFGQLCIVLPDKGESLTVLAECGNMQTEVDIIKEYLIDCKDDGRRYNQNGYVTKKTELLEENKCYACRESRNRVYGFELRQYDNNLNLTVKCDFGDTVITCGNGEFIKNSANLLGFTPSIMQLHENGRIEPFNVFASYTKTEKGVDITLRHYDCPHSQVWHFTDKALEISLTSGEIPFKRFDFI